MALLPPSILTACWALVAVVLPACRTVFALRGPDWRSQECATCSVYWMFCLGFFLVMGPLSFLGHALHHFTCTQEVQLLCLLLLVHPKSNLLGLFIPCVLGSASGLTTSQGKAGLAEALELVLSAGYEVCDDYAGTTLQLKKERFTAPLASPPQRLTKRSTSLDPPWNGTDAKVDEPSYGNSLPDLVELDPIEDHPEPESETPRSFSLPSPQHGQNHHMPECRTPRPVLRPEEALTPEKLVTPAPSLEENGFAALQKQLPLALVSDGQEQGKPESSPITSQDAPPKSVPLLVGAVAITESARLTLDCGLVLEDVSHVDLASQAMEVALSPAPTSPQCAADCCLVELHGHSSSSACGSNELKTELDLGALLEEQEWNAEKPQDSKWWSQSVKYKFDFPMVSAVELEDDAIDVFSDQLNEPSFQCNEESQDSRWFSQSMRYSFNFPSVDEDEVVDEVKTLNDHGCLAGNENHQLPHSTGDDGGLQKDHKAPQPLAIDANLDDDIFGRKGIYFDSGPAPVSTWVDAPPSDAAPKISKSEFLRRAKRLNDGKTLQKVEAIKAARAARRTHDHPPHKRQHAAELRNAHSIQAEEVDSVSTTTDCILDLTRKLPLRQRHHVTVPQLADSSQGDTTRTPSHLMLERTHKKQLVQRQKCEDIDTCSTSSDSVFANSCHDDGCSQAAPAHVLVNASLHGNAASECKIDCDILAAPQVRRQGPPIEESKAIRLPRALEAASSSPVGSSSQSPYVPNRQSVGVSRELQRAGSHRTLSRIEVIRSARDARRAQAELRRQGKQSLVAQGVDPDMASFKEMLDEWRQRHHNADIPLADVTMKKAVDCRIHVCLRKRPLSTKEQTAGAMDLVTTAAGGEVIMHELGRRVDRSLVLQHWPFQFDDAFDESVSNAELFDATARDLVDAAVLEGLDTTMFACGQTGSGKTFTMAGAAGLRSLQNVAVAEPGMYQLSAQRLFELLGQQPGEALRATVSFIEIYGVKVRDLLEGRREVKILEDARGHTRVVGASEVQVSSAIELCALIAQGSQLRVSRTMTQNSESSRSHAFLSVQLYSRGTGKPCGRFSLVDLAGNERGADNLAADAVARQESADINKSLLALKECIRSLARGRADEHTPFRQSKITTLLRESFLSPHARVCVLNCVSPGSTTSEYTLNTLRYAAMLKSQ